MAAISAVRGNINTSSTILHTPGAGKSTVIKSIVIANHDTTNVTVHLWVNGTVTGAYLISSKVMNPGKTYIIGAPDLVLDSWDSLVAIADKAGVSITVSMEQSDQTLVQRRLFSNRAQYANMSWTNQLIPTKNTKRLIKSIWAWNMTGYVVKTTARISTPSDGLIHLWNDKEIKITNALIIPNANILLNPGDSLNVYNSISNGVFWHVVYQEVD